MMVAARRYCFFAALKCDLKFTKVREDDDFALHYLLTMGNIPFSSTTRAPVHITNASVMGLFPVVENVTHLFS